MTQYLYISVGASWLSHLYIYHVSYANLLYILLKVSFSYLQEPNFFTPSLNAGPGEYDFFFFPLPILNYLQIFMPSDFSEMNIISIRCAMALCKLWSLVKCLCFLFSMSVLIDCRFYSVALTGYIIVKCLGQFMIR